MGHISANFFLIPYPIIEIYFLFYILQPSQNIFC